MEEGSEESHLLLCVARPKAALSLPSGSIAEKISPAYLHILERHQ